MKRPSPEALAKIAARSMCPTCDGREPASGEEAYASCIFCAAGLPRHPANLPHTKSA